MHSNLRNLLLSFAMLSFFASCGSTPSNKELLNNGENLTATREELEARLTKISYEKGGDFEFKAYPISESMIKIDVDNISAIRGFTKEEKKLYFDLKSQEFAFDKNCVSININKIGGSSNQSLNNWRVFLVDHLGRKVPTEIKPRSVRSFSRFYSGIHGRNATFTTQGVACSRVKIDLKKGFDLLISNGSIVDSTISTTLNWGS